jgi:hypothetical protein
MGVEVVPMSTPLRVGIYARVSTSDKYQDPETQLLPLREFASAQAWTIEGEYVDEASATNLRGRVRWRALLDAAAKRQIDLVVCWKLDRCFRSVLDANTTLQNLRRWGVGLRSYTVQPHGDVRAVRAVAHDEEEFRRRCWGCSLWSLWASSSSSSRWDSSVKGIVVQRIRAYWQRRLAEGRSTWIEAGRR